MDNQNRDHLCSKCQKLEKIIKDKDETIKTLCEAIDVSHEIQLQLEEIAYPTKRSARK